MHTAQQWRRAVRFSPDDGAGSGGGEVNAGQGQQTPPANNGQQPGQQQQPAGQQPAGQQTPPDYAWAGDDTAKSLAQKKGWATPGDAIKSYTELETLLGGEKLPLPKADTDKVGWDRVYKALGRPDTPDGYGIKPVEAAGEPGKALATEYSTKAHELGLTVKQATELQKWHDSKGGEVSAAEIREANQKLDQDIAAVKDNWGQNYNTNSETARRGADALGFDKDKIEAAEKTLGHKFIMDMFLKVGQTTGDAKFHQGNTGNGFSPQTKETAEVRRREIMDNPQLRTEALKQGSSIEQELDRLDKIIAGVRV